MDRWFNGIRAHFSDETDDCIQTVRRNAHDFAGAVFYTEHDNTPATVRERGEFVC